MLLPPAEPEHQGPCQPTSCSASMASAVHRKGSGATVLLISFTWGQHTAEHGKRRSSQRHSGVKSRTVGRVMSTTHRVPPHESSHNGAPSLAGRQCL